MSDLTIGPYTPKRHGGGQRKEVWKTALQFIFSIYRHELFFFVVGSGA
jgi:hypothetical protein